jgi:hypothetical protein
MNKPKLKLGILVDYFGVPSWAYNVLERMVNSSYAEFVLVIIYDDKGLNVPKFQTIWENKSRIIYDIFWKLDEMFIKRNQNAFEVKNIFELLADVPVVKVKPILDGDSELFKDYEIENIRKYQLDILIKIGFKNLQGNILKACRYGIWSIEHSDITVNRGGPPGFWEVFEHCPETGSILHVLNDQDSYGRVLYRSWFFTYPFSPARNRNYCFWASSSFLPRQIKLLYHLGEERFFEEVKKFGETFDFYDGKRYETPRNLAALGLFAKLLVRILFEVYKRAFYLDTWYLLVGDRKNTSLSIYKFKEIIPPKDRFWADPNVIQVGEEYYVFFEEYIYKKKKGHISVIKMDNRGNFKGVVPVLEKDYHLSYPFVFMWEGKYFMVPESAQNKSIELYESIEFPHKWELKITLKTDVTAVDSTLLHYRGKWWLFTGIAENEGSFPQVELFLFYSEKLFSKEWTAHPMNPVVSDVKTARPAGRILVENGRIYRPSQDCSKSYGYGLNLNEVLVLSETAYSEKKVISVKPNWNKKIKGLHTMGLSGEFTVIDGFMRRRRFL